MARHFFVLAPRTAHNPGRLRPKERSQPVRLPPRSPNLNSHLERFHLSIKSECLSRMIFFGETMLRNAVRPYLEHHHQERNHQGLGNAIPFPDEHVGKHDGEACD